MAGGGGCVGDCDPAALSTVSSQRLSFFGGILKLCLSPKVNTCHLFSTLQGTLPELTQLLYHERVYWL